MKTLLLLVVLSGSLFLGLRSSSDKPHVAIADTIFSDPAYNKVMPLGDDDYALHKIHMTERLEFIVAALQSRDVSDWPQALQVERARNIERLREYSQAEKYPINYDHPETQLPCFYDRDGNLCAVAHLVAESAGMPLVQKINSRYQYATIQQMNMPELDEWIATSGLTRGEVITIQRPGSRFNEASVRSEGIQISDPVPVDSTGQQTVQQGEPVKEGTQQAVPEPGLSQMEPAKAEGELANSK